MPLRFPGQYFDKETNLAYNYFRDYDPAMGRYVQSDPIGLAGGINTYAYVASNPLLVSDSSGLNPMAAARVGYAVGQAFNAALNYTLVATTGLTLGGLLYEAINESYSTESSTSAQRQSEYQRMKDFCDKPPQPSGNECSDLSKQIDHYENCISWYRWWDRKWNAGRHQGNKIVQWQNRVDRLKRTHNKKCVPCP